MRNVDPSMAVANVIWLPLPSANDTVEGPIDFTNIICWDHLGSIVTSGDGFPVGLTTVTCRANDTVPNEGSCDFNITIIDSEAPFVYCPADIPLIYVDQGMANASVTWIPLPTANDTVDGPINATSIVCSDDLGNVVESGDRFQVRLTTVTCRVNDSASLEGMCQFNITVEDNEPPTVSCPDHIVDLSDLGMPGALIPWIPLPTASDNLDVINQASIVCTDDSGTVVMSGNLFGVGLTTVTCRANDTALNEGSCNFTIAVSDNESPNVTCPMNVSAVVDSGKAVATILWVPTPSAVDNVDTIDPASIICVDNSGSIVTSGGQYPANLTTVTCQVNDTQQNEGSCSFTIAVSDNESPNVTCPMNVSAVVDSGSAVGTILWVPTPSAVDNVDTIDPASIICVDNSGSIVMSGDQYPANLTTVTCRVNDTQQNEGSCSFTIAVSDNESPNVTCPMNVSAVVDSGSAVATILWVPTPSAVDNVDTIDPASIICVDNSGSIVMSGDQYPANLTTVTCRVNDTQQNEGSCSFTIAVSDNESPNVTCPMNVSAVVDSGSAAATILWEPTPSAVDNIDTIDPASIICVDNSGSIVTSGGQYPANLTTVTCQVNDTQQNEGSCSFTIAVSDNESPNVTCPMNVSAVVDSGSAAATILWEPTPSAVDNIDTIDPASIICVDNSGSIVTSGGQYPATLSTVTCRVNDTQQNEGSCTFTIAVSDNESPNVTCPMNVSAVVDSGSAVATILWEPTPSAVDNIDTIDPASIICVDNSGSIVMSGDQYPANLTTVTCRVNDTQQNEGSCDFSIAVVDNEPPTVTCPSPNTTFVDPNMAGATVFWSTLPTAIDVVDPTIDPNTIVCKDSPGSVVVSGGFYQTGVTTVTCKANDTALNEGLCSFIITVIDNESPTVNCPSPNTTNVDSGAAGATVFWSSSPTATDFGGVPIDPNTIVCEDSPGSVVVSGGFYQHGLTTVTCKANDTSLNEGSCSFMITVIDNDVPVVSCPNPIIKNVDFRRAGASVTWSPSPTATDIVDATVNADSVVCEDHLGNVVTSGGFFQAGVTTVTCRANDTSLNEGSCAFFINVTDNEAPIVSCPDSIPSLYVPIGSTEGNATWSSAPTASDVVDASVIASNVVCNDGTSNVVSSGDNYPLGLTEVNCSVSDTAANVGSCQFYITVLVCPLICMNDGILDLTICSCNCAQGWTGDNCTICPLNGTSCFNGGTYNVLTCGCTCPAGLNTLTCEDTEAPVVTVPNDVPGTNVEPGTPDAVVVWAPAPSAFDTFEGSVGAAAIQCQDQTGRAVTSASRFPVGLTTVTCTASDSSLNEGSNQFNITVIDNEAPIITTPSDVLSINVETNMASVVVNWSPAPSAEDTVEGVITAIACQNQLGAVVASGDRYPVGTTTVNCTASDSVPNTATKQFTITVVDNEPPTVTCPTPGPVTFVETGVTSAIVSWTQLPTANDVVDGPILAANIICENTALVAVTSGSSYPIGTTTVTCKASDAALNEGVCSFDVAVEVCGLNCMNSGAVDLTNCSCNCVQGWTGDTCTVCPLDSVSCVNGGTFNNVTCECICSTGLSAPTCEDIEAPVVTAPNNIRARNVDSGSATATVTWSPLLPSAYDSFQGVIDSTTIICRTADATVVVSGSAFPVGTSLVTCTATDASGNEGMDQFTIMVVDNEGPVITTPTSVPGINVERGMPDVVVNWSPMPSATDSVDGPILSAEIRCEDDAGNVVMSGDRFRAGTTTVTCKANDTSLNEGSAQFTIIVIDNEAPDVTCSADFPSVFVNPLDGSTPVTWSLIPFADDIVDGPISVTTCTDISGNIVSSGDSFSLGTTTVTCRANDTSMNEGTCSFDITVAVCSLICTNGGTLELATCTCNCAQGWTGSDCSACPLNGGSCLNGGTYDGPNCGCICPDPALDVTCADIVGPIVSVPPDISGVNVDAGRPDAVVDWIVTPTANDAWEGTILASTIDCTDQAGNIVTTLGRYQVGVTTVTCIATDSSGNEGSSSFNITVIDNEPPIISTPANVTTNVTSGTTTATVNWSPEPSAIDAVSGAVNSEDIVCRDQLNNVVVSGDSYPVGTTTVTCSASDAAQNEGSNQFVITILDNDPPVLTCPEVVPGFFVAIGTPSTLVPWVPSVSAVDVVEGVIGDNLILCSDGAGSVTSGTPFPVGESIVFCRASDSELNEGLCSFQITVQECPLSCMNNGILDLTVCNCDCAQGWIGDNCTACPLNGGSCLNGGTYDSPSCGCICPDPALSATCADIQPPVLTLPNDVPGQPVDAGRPDAVVAWSSLPTAVDAWESTLNLIVVCEDQAGNVVTSGDRYPVGLTTVTCRANDTSMNEASDQFTITVIDNEGPVITVPSSIPSINVDSGFADAAVTWSPPQPSATDNAEGPITPVVCTDGAGNVVSSGDTFAVGLTTVTCRASDSRGNAGMAQFTITVVDNEGPVLTIPASVPGQNVDTGRRDAVVAWSLTPSANDVVEGATAVVCTDSLTGQVVTSGARYPVGVTVVTCTSSDSVPNTSTGQFSITIIDNEPPVFITPNNVSSASVDAGRADSIIVWAPPLSATDIVDGLIPSTSITCVDDLGVSVASGDRYAVGVTTVYCSVRDAALNLQTTQFVITVLDTEPPSVTCPINVSSVFVLPGVTSAIVTWSQAPSAIDVVDTLIPAEAIQCADDIGTAVTTGQGYPVGTTTVTCTATDSASNPGTCQFTITVEVCTLTCENGGSLNTETCSCTCAQEYTGTNCSVCAATCLNGATQDGACGCSCAQSWTGGVCSVCPLDSGSCLNGGTFDAPMCECVCLPGIFGATCQEADPCLTSPCTGVGEYCKPDPYTAANGYTCECRLLDGYSKVGNACVARRSITIVLRVLGVNGIAVTFLPIYANPHAASTRTLLLIISDVISFHLRRDLTVSDFMFSSGIALSEGSLIATTVLSLPSTSTTTPEMVMEVLNNDITESSVGALSDGEYTLNVDPNVAAKESTTSCSASFCQNGGLCNGPLGTYPTLTYTCSCLEGFTGTNCETLIVEATTAGATAAPSIGGLSTLAIVLIVVGIIALVLMFLGICMCLCIIGRRRYEAGQRYDSRRQQVYKDQQRRMAYGRRSFGLDEYDNGHTPGSAGTLYNGSDMEDRRMGRLAQVLARSPYMQQSAQSREFVRPYVATGLEAMYYDQQWVNEEEPPFDEGRLPTRVARNPLAQ
ncbi:uncharacterized protein LOC117302922 [Asterias rubens]|uniref:uncharacterized protein LOC117302922 n=1 Tax=Asterias rubens TaxID=7604 RepID=UPI0014550491|nr:uncharacterized protein LOC117302922 [Asterias rubens]XP_033642800.1 uncharacterized protein LOC117302922 [Asterias rubens]